MATTARITARSGVVIVVEEHVEGGRVNISVRNDSNKDCLFHWGLIRRGDTSWQPPPKAFWPQGTRAFDKNAVQTPFVRHNGSGQIDIKLEKASDYLSIRFVLYFPEEDLWDNNQGRNYRIGLPKPDRPPVDLEAVLKKATGRQAVTFEQMYQLENEARMAVAVGKEQGHLHVHVVTDVPGPLTFHWGTAVTSRHEWVLPPSSTFPEGTTAFRNKAAETPFSDCGSYLQISFTMAEREAPLGIPFVLRNPQTDRCQKDHGGHNFFIPLVVPAEYEAALGDPGMAAMADQIIDKEMGRNSWTLMHRFNLCHDLLETAVGNREALSLLFVWLRFSALRQLDWQRNYNTQPRELSHALDRLTVKLADSYAQESAGSDLIRLMLTTMGRGGEGQKVRDEVLNIMHRHHIKEVSGHFMEEWHQKLHNNTTPDDVVICQAYLAFLKDNGNPDVFYETLEAGGISKKRLESYERPILSHPDFIPHLKDALIHDFEHFLGILKGVHSATDLGAAIEAAAYLFDDRLRGLLDAIWRHRDDGEMPPGSIGEWIAETRRILVERIRREGKNARDLLLLDQALENFLRVVVERRLHLPFDPDELVTLIALVTENLLFSMDHEELTLCLRQWNHLREIPRWTETWSLQAQAVLDRLGRALGAMIDANHRLLQPKADLLGRAFHADTWTVSLFGEEVIRGSLLFVMSVLLRKIDPILRDKAHLGDWQVISPGSAVGEVKVVSDLGSVQGEDFARSTVVIAQKVSGDEEIPQGVTAVITADTTDIVSHVAIRARNAGVLFVTCYGETTMARLKTLKGRWIRVTTDPSGSVVFEEADRPQERKPPKPSIVLETLRLSLPDFSSFTVASRHFNRNIVGAKSNNLNGLRDRLPEWIQLPASLALPFGVFEKTLSHGMNKKTAVRYDALVRKVDEVPQTGRLEILGKLQEAILALKAPHELTAALHQALNQTGLEKPADGEAAWTCIKKVWASKWNERAYLSRKARGIPHENLFMAVLIQQVVDAEYSFVIHSANPFSGDRTEVFAEVVPGLGETLVGNYPGKALSFTCKKGHNEPRLHAFPSKSIGLFGKGLIFRSDSNGEDLADYAGAGLYDSVMSTPPRRTALDYTQDRLMTDESFRDSLLTDVAAIGVEVEKVLGRPQDIEGAYAQGKYVVVQTRPQVGIGRG